MFFSSAWEWRERNRSKQNKVSANADKRRTETQDSLTKQNTHTISGNGVGDGRWNWHKHVIQNAHTHTLFPNNVKIKSIKQYYLLSEQQYNTLCSQLCFFKDTNIFCILWLGFSESTIAIQMDLLNVRHIKTNEKKTRLAYTHRPNGLVSSNKILHSHNQIE